MNSPRDPRIDAYIAQSAPFAQPILRHLREVVHQGCPDVEETIKWGMPCFVKNGILCFTAAFKAHAALGFRRQHEAIVLRELGTRSDAAMGHLGRITRLADLPPAKKLLRCIRRAAELNAASGRPRNASRSKSPAAPVVVPADLKNALASNKAAAKTFAAFSPSNQREYADWITEAKRPETREKRLATTLEWLREGKSRNWKYEPNKASRK